MQPYLQQDSGINIVAYLRRAIMPQLRLSFIACQQSAGEFEIRKIEGDLQPFDSVRRGCCGGKWLVLFTEKCSQSAKKGVVRPQFGAQHK
jgi:hypothetical protein